MISRKEKRAKIRGELIKGRTVTCTSCNLSLKIGFRKDKTCLICGNILPKPAIDKLKLIDKWRIKTTKEKFVVIDIACFVISLIASFGIALEFAIGW